MAKLVDFVDDSALSGHRGRVIDYIRTSGSIG
jgi:hypothetical protein